MALVTLAEFERAALRLRWGSADRVVPVRDALEDYETNYGDRAGSERVDRLLQIVDECGTYLDDAERKTSKRRPAVEALRDSCRSEIPSVLVAGFMRACGQNEPAEIDALVERGFDVKTVVQPEGATTALHYAIRLGRLEIVQKVLALEPDLEKANSNGLSPLLYAANLGNRDICEALLDAGADATKTQAGGFTALDLARSRCFTALEASLLQRRVPSVSLNSLQPNTRARIERQASGEMVRPIRTRRISSSLFTAATIDSPAEPLHTVDLLVLATAEDHRNAAGGDDGRDVAAAYWALYQVPEFRPLLGAVALASIGNRFGAAGDACRILATNHRDTGDISALGAGLFHIDNSVALFAAKVSQPSMEGTIIHELCHATAQYVFQNNCCPFDPVEGEGGRPMADDSYKQAFESDLLAHFDEFMLKHQMSTDADSYASAQPPDRVGLVDDLAFITLLGRLWGYMAKPAPLMGDGARAEFPMYNRLVMFEAIVGVPQAWHVYGRDKCDRFAPQMTQYFEQTFLPRVEAWIQGHPQARWLDPLPLRDGNVGERRLPAASCIRGASF